MNLYSQMDMVAVETSSCRAWRGLVISIVVLYRKIIGSTGIFQAEARVLLQGLNLAWDRGFYQVEVEPDSALLIELVKLGLDDPHVRVKIRHIRGLCRKNWLLQLLHVKREVNGCADQLARIYRRESAY
ncbi:hypothetical protein PVK06_031196 [Gossypium arboreum]|uniref:RNase H type-1 domain-containing protein n=1 Tax=Gossypium arboreum TaxID=29729 RepID=A0ABR0NQE7_GOSAR|nr:hypothetical protein PVK06_031196 [Gossypium arboreum]